MLTLVASALAGGDCIDDADALRAGGTVGVLGCVVKAPSTLGTFLRSFRWGHVRQLDRVSRQLLARAWAAGAGPGDSPLTIDLDSTICETYGLAKEGARHHGYTGARGYHPLLAIAAGTGEVLMSRLREGRANTARGAAHFLRETVGRVRYGGARGQLTVRADSGFYAHTVVAACREMDVRFSITIRQRASLRDLIEAIPEEDWTPIPYWTDGAADVAETTYTPFQTKPDAAPVRLIVRRVKPTPGSQLALFARYSYHAFITDRDGETLELEADHRRHAEVENAIRDLKYGVGLNHMPSAPSWRPPRSIRTCLAETTLPTTRASPDEAIAKELDDLLGKVGLAERANSRFRTYSLGMKQRLGLAYALLGDLELLFLDEPTNGMDPAGMAEVRDMIRGLGTGGRTVLLSSHLLHEVEQVCDSVAILSKGKLIAQGKVADLVHTRAGERVRLRTTDNGKAVEVLSALEWVEDVRIEGESVIVEAPSERSSELSAALGRSEVYVTEMAADEMSLEQYFLEITGDGHKETG